MFLFVTRQTRVRYGTSPDGYRGLNASRGVDLGAYDRTHAQISPSRTENEICGSLPDVVITEAVDPVSTTQRDRS